MIRKRMPRVAQQAVEFILTRKLEDLGDLTETGIAKAINVNLTHLSRKFKKHQKIALKDFIIREKIHTAIFMLEKHHNISIEELAGKLGFPDIDQFIRAFRNYIGADPLTYQDVKHHRHPVSSN